MPTAPASDPFALLNTDTPTGEQAADALDSFGRLGQYLLSEGWLRTAHVNLKGPREPFPGLCRLPGDIGCCPALGVWNGVVPAGGNAGFVLPLAWRGTPDHEVPEALQTFSKQVKELLLARLDTGAARANDWHLGWHSSVRPSRAISALGQREFGATSAWVALAGGLWLAVHEAEADPKVVATGAWEAGTGVRGVKGIPAKLEAAARHGARWAFVPERENGDEAKGWAEKWNTRHPDQEVSIGLLKQGDPNPIEAMRNYLDHLSAAPPKPNLDPKLTEAVWRTQLDRCARYYNGLSFRSKLATDYYWDSMLDAVAKNATQELVVVGGDRRPPVTHLITFAGGGVELIPLAAKILPTVTRVFVLHTRPLDPAVRRRMESKLTATLTTRHVTEESQIAEFVQQDAREAGRGNAILDLTTGTGRQRWLADRAMPSGSWRFWLNAEHDAKLERPVPGTEKPIVERVN